MLDFNREQDGSLASRYLTAALKEVDQVLRLRPDDVLALRMKFSILERPSVHFDPKSALALAERAIELQPHAYEFILEVAQWLADTGVRIYAPSKDRVPYDAMVVMERAKQLLGRVLDEAAPYAREEQRALYWMGRTLANDGKYEESLAYFEARMTRDVTPEERSETLREDGASLYRLGRHADAAKAFASALQLRPTLADRWLLRVSLEAFGADVSRLPQNLLFPLRQEEVDAMNPPALSFTDIAPELGIDRLNGNGTCAWGDYDGDGDQDLAVAGTGTFITLYRNDGNKFVDVTEEAGLGHVPSGYSLNFVDYDNDGKPDLYVCLDGWSGPMPNRLFRNLGNGRFKDVSKEAGLDDPGSGFVSLWGDLDGDGYLDLVVANGVLKDGSVLQAYRNNGNGTFSNVTTQAGLVEPPEYGGIGIALGDYDRDGDLDLFVDGFEGAPNRLYRNDGHFKFTEVAAQAGVLQPPHAGYVCFFVDYNNDGYPDILTTSLAPWPAVLQGLTSGFTVQSADEVHPDSSRLFRNNRDGTFTDVTFESKLYYPVGTMGAGVADLDNDGFVDIYLGVGDPRLHRLEPNRFFRNNGDGTFSDLSFFAGLGHLGKGHGVAFIDLDDDGDLDIYAQIGGHHPGDFWRNKLFRNNWGNRNNWLQVDLIGTRSNRYAVGAVLVLKAGGMTLYREVKGSEGFGSTSPYRVSVGLGKSARIDSVTVLWPSGLKQEFKDLTVNQRIEIKEGTDTWRVVK
jgi:tetratricopeptide (TPR) repeat protein